MLVALPIGAFGLAVTSDAVEALTGSRNARATARMALDFGIVTALAAAPFGFVDWSAITPRTRAARVGFWHGAGNLSMLALFTTARLLRRGAETPRASRWFAAAGLALSGVTAWLGGELVDRHGIGVSDRIGENVPSSLAPSAEGKLAAG
jgi:uncharacterized membrane protein